MRQLFEFDKFDYLRQQKILKNMWSALNDGLFNGTLHEIPIDIQNVRTWTSADNPMATYLAPNIIHKDGLIALDYRFIEESSNESEYNGDGWLFAEIAHVLLHEMVHQYITENNIPFITPHDDTFINEAEKRGLISIYEDEILMDEYLTDETDNFIMEMYLRWFYEVNNNGKYDL